MAECNFKFNINLNPDEIINTVKSKIENEGGKFSGDEQEGNFTLPTPVGEIEGNYSIMHSELNINISKKPMMIPCSMIESELAKRLR